MERRATAGKVPASVFRIFRERKGIVLAHLKETLDYYVRLRVAENRRGHAHSLDRQEFTEAHAKISPLGGCKRRPGKPRKGAGPEVTRRASRDWNLTQHPAILYEI